VSGVEERLPGLVLAVGQLQIEHRAAFRLFRLAYQVHAGFLGSPAALTDVARDAGADDVLPGAGTPLAARHDVVEAQLACGKLLAAVLALVVIAGEYVPPVELYRLLGQAVVANQANDPRHLDFAVHGADPVVVLLTEVTGPKFADLAPGGKIVGREA